MVAKKTLTLEGNYARLIDEMLVYVSCAAYNRSRQWGPAMPSFGSFIDAIMTERRRRGLKAVSPEELPADWSASMLTIQNQRRQTLLPIHLCHARVLSAGEVLQKRRWGIMRVSDGPFVVGSSITIKADGSTIHYRHYFRQSSRPPNYWKDVSDRPVGEHSMGVRYTATGCRRHLEDAYTWRTYDPGFMAPIAWARRHLWTVELSSGPESAALLFVTNALGVKGFFTARDKPDGKTRRDALQHWVRTHTRSLVSDPDAEVQVRQHLRGRTEFDWFGLHGKVNEPDLVLNPYPSRSQ